MTKARSLKTCLRAWLRLTEHRGGGEIPKFSAYEAKGKLKALRRRATDALATMRGASELPDDVVEVAEKIIRDFGEATRYDGDPFEIAGQ